MLLIFKASKRKKYSIEALTFLAHQKFTLSSRLAHQQLWSRFINTSGKEGHNIPCDLHMEHLNRVLKDSIQQLGANKTKQAIIRAGKCIDKLEVLRNNYDEDNEEKSDSGYHAKASTDKLILDELSHVQPFRNISRRKYSAFSFSKTLWNLINCTYG